MLYAWDEIVKSGTTFQQQNLKVFQRKWEVNLVFFPYVLKKMYGWIIIKYNNHTL